MNQVVEYVINGDLKRLAKEIKSGTDINTCERDGRTLLMIAVSEKKLDLLQYLIKKGADIDRQDDEGNTALHYACNDNNLEAVKILIENKAAVDIKDIHGNTPLSNAVYFSNGYGDVITLLLKHGADKNLKNNYGISPLELAKGIANFNVIQFFD